MPYKMIQSELEEDNSHLRVVFQIQNYFHTKIQLIKIIFSCLFYLNLERGIKMVFYFKINKNIGI